MTKSHSGSRKTGKKEGLGLRETSAFSEESHWRFPGAYKYKQEWERMMAGNEKTVKDDEKDVRFLGEQGSL